MSCVDHFIVTENVFDSIVSNNVIVDPTNPSNHNFVVLSVNCFTMSAVVHDHVMNNERRSDCNWKNSTHAEHVNYNICLDFKLSQLELPIELFNCTNIFYKNWLRVL